MTNTDRKLPLYLIEVVDATGVVRYWHNTPGSGYYGFHPSPSTVFDRDSLILQIRMLTDLGVIDGCTIRALGVSFPEQVAFAQGEYGVLTPTTPHWETDGKPLEVIGIG